MVNLRSLSAGLNVKRKSADMQQLFKTFQDCDREMLDGIDRWLQTQILPSYTMTISRSKGLPPKPSEVEECEHLIHSLRDGILDTEALNLRAQDQIRRELLLSQATVMVEVLIDHLDTLSKGSDEDVLQALKFEGVELPSTFRTVTRQHSRSSLVESEVETELPLRREERARDLIALALKSEPTVSKIAEETTQIETEDFDFSSLMLDSALENEAETIADFRATTPSSSKSIKSASDHTLVASVLYTLEAEEISAIAEQDAESKHSLTQTDVSLAGMREDEKKGQAEETPQDIPDAELVKIVNSSPKERAISKIQSLDN